MTHRAYMPRSDSRETFDVAVIGAGVFGAWTAYQLQQSGKRVVLVDPYGAGNSRSSSGGESRIIRMGYGTDEIYTRSAQHALRLWQEFFAVTGDPLFLRTGVLWLAHADDPYPSQCTETLERVGVPFEKLSTVELQLRYPQMQFDGIEWAMFEPDSGALLARRAVQAVVREAIRNGVVYLEDAVKSPADAQRLDNITTAGGRTLSAATYVFACGPWLPKIFPEVLQSRIHPTRQEVFFFGSRAGDSRFIMPDLPIWIDFRDEAYGFPDLEGRGIKVAIDRHGAAFDPDAGDRLATEVGLAEVRRYLARRLPEMKDAPVTETRVCQYENTANGDFLIDRHPGFDNVWLVGGGSGHGFKHGPVVGEYVTARLEGRSEIEPRFTLATKAETQNRSVF
jgi:monomeric sarcosine oxidase